MEDEVRNVILGQAGERDKFTIKYLGINWKLSIKPLTAKMLIEISAEMSHVSQVDDSKEMFPTMMDGAPSLRHLAKIISIATGTRYRKIVTRTILRLPLKDIQTLIGIVVKQTDMTVFFYTIISLKGIQSLTKAIPEEQ